MEASLFIVNTNTSPNALAVNKLHVRAYEADGITEYQGPGMGGSQGDMIIDPNTNFIYLTIGNTGGIYISNITAEQAKNPSVTDIVFTKIQNNSAVFQHNAIWANSFGEYWTRVTAAGNNTGGIPTYMKLNSSVMPTIFNTESNSNYKYTAELTIGNDACACEYKIEIKQNVSKTEVCNNEPFEYSFQVMNKKQFPASGIQTGITFVDTLSANLTYTQTATQLESYFRSIFGSSATVTLTSFGGGTNNILLVEELAIPENLTSFAVEVKAVGIGASTVLYNQAMLKDIGAGYDDVLSDYIGNPIWNDATPVTVMPLASTACPLRIAGNVFNDVNGLKDNTVNGTGIGSPSGTPLYANLYDATGAFVASVAVASSGAYSFTSNDGVALNTQYSIQITTVQATSGQNLSAVPTTLPTGWVNTGENIGADAGNDNDTNGILAVSVGADEIDNINFGIEQLPTPSNITATSQINPGGTTQATVPAATFDATDPDGGVVDSIRITQFPTNATTIVINGVSYTSSTFPIEGVTVPTNASGQPTQTITVDPQDGAVTVDIPYVAIDNAGKESTVIGSAKVPFTSISIHGNVFNDLNGLKDNTVNGTGIGSPSGTPLYANLLNSAGVVIATVQVGTNGTYTFTEATANTNYTVQISTHQGVVGNATPSTELPINWVNTGENVGTSAGNDGTVNGLLTITTTTVDLHNVNFGIEQLPTPSNITAPSQVNPGGTTQATVPAATFGATDPDGGVVDSIRITQFPTNATTIVINGVSYTSSTFPTEGVTVPTNANGQPTQTITVDPQDGAVTVDIPYVAIDNAGKESTVIGFAKVPFTIINIQGNVYNDVNGLTDNTVNGIGIGSPSGVPLYANLLNSAGQVVATVPVGINGVYTFTEVSPNTNYSVQISNQQGVVGNNAPIAQLPNNWVNTGENVGSGPGNDGIVNGLLAIATTTVDLHNVNFGIEQLPTPNSVLAPSKINPGGTTQSTVASSLFGATDPDGGRIDSIRITQFPTNTTTIVINGVSYTSSTFPTEGVTVPTNANGQPTQTITVDPQDGAVLVDIPYVAIDNAGKESTVIGSVKLPFNTINLSGNVFNDLNGLVDNTVNGDGLNNPDGTVLYANLLNSAGEVVASVPVGTNGSYTFTEVSPNTNYTVQVSTVQGVVGNPEPANTLPPHWVYTGEFIGTTAGNDLNINGKISVNVAEVNVNNVNFGINKRSIADDKNHPLSYQPAVNEVLPLNGSGTNPPLFSGIDHEDGTYTGINSTLTSPIGVVITQLPDNGELWYNGSIVTATDVSTGTIFTNPTLFSVVLTNAGYTSTTFNYAYIDAAHILGVDATYTISWLIPLPIKLSSFDVVKKDNTALLNWTTSSEQNSKGFEVEHSNDGQHWTTVSFVSTKAENGNSNHLLNYSFTHLKPSIGKNIYRLKQLDIDGKFDYSEVRVLTFEDNRRLSVYPNPATEILNIKGLQGAEKITVYDVTGKLMIETKAKQSEESISLHNLSNGNYTINIITESGSVSTFKFTKSN